MKKQKTKSKVKMKFFADLSFNLNPDEVWEELSSHNENKFSNYVPIKLHILKSISEISSFLNRKNCIQIPLF
jgi:hypothetical protein